MGKMREKGAIAGYVLGPFGTDYGRYRTVMDVNGRYLGHRFSGFKGICWLGGKVPQGRERTYGTKGTKATKTEEGGKMRGIHGAHAVGCREDF